MIKELTNEEAARLREFVKNRFLQSPFNGAGFRLSQHKASYQHLVGDIVRVVPGTEASVTTNRLRKFFYYTNPEVCAPDKLEKPSFGDDFIQVLFKYIEVEPKPVVKIPKSQQFPRKWLLRVGALLLLLASAIAAWQWLDQPKYWEENFDSVSIDSLKSRGWEILDYDPVAFSRQLKPGYLTLYTYPGDYWVKWELGERPMIKNMLVKRLNCSRCVVTTQLIGFDPNQNHQQAGIFLFDSNIDRKNCFWGTVGYTKVNERVIPFGGDWTNQRQTLGMILIKNGRVEETGGIPIRYPEFQPEELEDVGIYIVIDGQNVTVRLWRGPKWNQLSFEKWIVKLPFSPKYVGLAAFQGFTDEQGKPKGADTIPAFFDYLKVEPLPE